MEPIKPLIEKDNKKPSIKKKSFMKKLDSESMRLLQSLKDKANKKTFGRKVRDIEILGLGLSLITSEQIQKLQDATLTEKDRLHMAHEDYMKSHGKLTLDQFIGKLLNGEIKKAT